MAQEHAGQLPHTGCSWVPGAGCCSMPSWLALWRAHTLAPRAHTQVLLTIGLYSLVALLYIFVDETLPLFASAPEEHGRGRALGTRVAAQWARRMWLCHTAAIDVHHTTVVLHHVCHAVG